MMKTLGLVWALGWLVMLAGATALAPGSRGQSETPLREIKSSQSRCPLITVSCPSEARDGEPIVFSATIKDADPSAVLTYNWSVDRGTIIEGQGTHTIKVKSLGVSSWTASLKVGGLDPSCASTASCTLTVCREPLRRMFASYEALSNEEEIKRLASFADELENERGSQAYILSFARPGGSADETKASLYRAKTYLVGERGIDVDRVVTVEGGFKDRPTIELWVVPLGAALPKAAEFETPVEPKKKSPTSP